MECSVPTIDSNETYSELKEAFGSQQYWVRFFMRPCCPPPGEDVARSMIEHLKSDLDMREDLSEEERSSLKDIFDERLTWYLQLPVRHTA